MAQTVDLPPAAANEIANQLKSLDRGQTGTKPSVSDLDKLRAESVKEPAEAAPRDDATPSSRLELSYSTRARASLLQYGYRDISGASPAGALLNGSVPDDYVLGIGDELVVTLRGQVNRSQVLRVDREGRVAFENLPPMAAAGQRLDEFRAELGARVAAAYVQTDAFVSLGSVRSISVVMTGEVTRPGRRTLTSFSSLLDAIIDAGGVTRSGSLRSVTLVRDGKSTPLDLYGILKSGRGAVDARLADGDQIIVGTIGRTVAVSGDVNRPGIFELPPDSDTISIAAALELAGRTMRAKGNRLLVLRLDASGRDTLIAIEPTASLQPNDILMVDRPPGAVALDGAVKLPGERSIGAVKTVSQLLRTPDFLQRDPYLPFAVLITEEPTLKVRRFVPINLDMIFAGRMDISLRSEDTVVVLSRDDVRYLFSADVQAVLAGRPPPGAGVFGATGTVVTRGETREDGSGMPSRGPTGENVITKLDAPTSTNATHCAGLRSLSEVAGAGTAVRFTAASRFLETSANAVVANVRPCPDIFNRHPDLLPFALEYAVSVQGELRIPGVYPVLPDTPIDTVIRAAGGVTLEADAKGVEITRSVGLRENAALLTATTLTVSPGDSLRISQRQTERELGYVEVSGEVLRPGRLELRRGDRLSDVLARVGGLGPSAYTYGTVFTRERIKATERANNDKLARELEAALPAMMLASSSEPGSQARNALPVIQSLVASIRSAPTIGRLTVEADPAILAVKPELDVILEGGDRIYIPKRPTHVTVSGEVLNPSSLIFRSGMTADDYIRLAGGVKPSGDLSSAFIIFPNGESAPLSVGRWRSDATIIPPGSTILVPRDPQPFNWVSVSKDFLAIFRDLAVSAASIAVIGK